MPFTTDFERPRFCTLLTYGKSTGAETSSASDLVVKSARLLRRRDPSLKWSLWGLWLGVLPCSVLRLPAEKQSNSMSFDKRSN